MAAYNLTTHMTSLLFFFLLKPSTHPSYTFILHVNVSIASYLLHKVVVSLKVNVLPSLPCVSCVSFYCNPRTPAVMYQRLITETRRSVPRATSTLPFFLIFNIFDCYSSTFCLAFFFFNSHTIWNGFSCYYGVSWKSNFIRLRIPDTREW